MMLEISHEERRRVLLHPPLPFQPCRNKRLFLWHPGWYFGSLVLFHKSPAKDDGIPSKENDPEWWLMIQECALMICRWWCFFLWWCRWWMLMMMLVMLMMLMIVENGVFPWQDEFSGWVSMFSPGLSWLRTVLLELGCAVGQGLSCAT